MAEDLDSGSLGGCLRGLPPGRALASCSLFSLSGLLPFGLPVSPRSLLCPGRLLSGRLLPGCLLTKSRVLLPADRCGSLLFYLLLRLIGDKRSLRDQSLGPDDSPWRGLTAIVPIPAAIPFSSPCPAIAAAIAHVLVIDDKPDMFFLWLLLSGSSPIRRLLSGLFAVGGLRLLLPDRPMRRSFLTHLLCLHVLFDRSFLLFLRLFHKIPPDPVRRLLVEPAGDGLCVRAHLLRKGKDILGFRSNLFC